MKLFKRKNKSSRKIKHLLRRVKPDRKAIAASFRTVASRNGAYSATAIVLVIIIAIVVNLACSNLPASVKQIDVSRNKVYEISDTSRQLLKGLDKEVSITVIAESDSMNEMLSNFLERYVAISDKVTMETIDPVAHPSALTEYDTESDTVIVSCEETGLETQIPFSDILIESMSYYYTGSSSLSSFDGEGQLTSAVNQVTGGESRKVYCLTDHGETDLSSTMTSLMSKSGISVEYYSLIMKNKIPDDCDMILINGLSSDISDDEASLLDKYIKGGGNVVILLGQDSPESGNVIDLMKKYGIKQQKGYVADMERNYQGNYFYIFPEITASTDMTDGLDTGLVLMSNSRGFTTSESSEELSITSLLQTSSNGYMVSEDSEKQGTFDVAVQSQYTAADSSNDSSEVSSDGSSEESSGDGDSDSDSEDSSVSDSEGSSNSDSEDSEDSVITGTLTVFGSNSIIDENITSAFSGLDNTSLFMNSVTGSIGDMNNLSIEAKSLEVQYNTPQYGGPISIFLIFVIPLGFVIAGFIFWRKRRSA